MLRNFLKNRKAQNTAEYALLIALVVAGVIGMQTYAQRAMQARIHDAAQYMASGGGAALPAGLGTNTQYEPYYTQSNYDVNSNSVDNKRLGQNLIGADSQSNRTRTGSQNSTYNAEDMNNK